MTLPVGVILAGGLASRMGGGDKGLLNLGNGYVLDHVLYRLRPQVGKIALNVNGCPKRFSMFDLPIIPDSMSGYLGPLAGVLAGLDWAAEKGAEQIITVAADTPFFADDLTHALSEACQIQKMPIALAATQGTAGRVFRHPTFGLWPVSLRHDLRAALELGMRKVIVWAEKHGTAEAMFATDLFDPFFNINTPEDLKKAEAML
ncbi:molybdenum cofactor guanylyltransferase MobA [Planktomarina sp.]|nr:molybdenum cofactor guanylyltransferase MobA [Planktomarina sp.]